MSTMKFTADNYVTPCGVKAQQQLNAQGISN